MPSLSEICSSTHLLQMHLIQIIIAIIIMILLFWVLSTFISFINVFQCYTSFNLLHSAANSHYYPSFTDGKLRLIEVHLVSIGAKLEFSFIWLQSISFQFPKPLKTSIILHNIQQWNIIKKEERVVGDNLIPMILFTGALSWKNTAEFSVSVPNNN